MKLGDVYINKKDKSIIQIDSYATHMRSLARRYDLCKGSNITGSQSPQRASETVCRSLR